MTAPSTFHVLKYLIGCCSSDEQTLRNNSQYQTHQQWMYKPDNTESIDRVTSTFQVNRLLPFITKNLFLHFFFLAAKIQQKLHQALESCSVNLRMGELKGHFYLVWGIIWAILLLCPIFSRLHSYYSSLLLHVYPVGRHNTSWVSEFLVWRAQQGYPNGIFTLKEWFCLSLMSL